MLILPRTLFFYLSRVYWRYFISVFLILAFALFISTTFDAFYRFKQSCIPTITFIELSLLKLPYLSSEVLVFINLITATLFFRYMIYSKELIIILCSGISIWRIITTLCLVCFFSTIIFVLATNLFSATLLTRHYELEKSIRSEESNSKVIDLLNTNGIIISETYNLEKRIIITKNISVSSRTLNPLTILIITPDNSFLTRIDADYAILENDKFIIYKPIIWKNDNNTIHNITEHFSNTELEIKEELNDNSDSKLTHQSSNLNELDTVELRKEYNKQVILPTRLSINDLTTSAIPPEHLSIFQLPSFINRIKEFGLPSENYEIFFYKQIYKPLFLVASLLIAVCFIRLDQKNNSTWKNITYSLIYGFMIYVIAEIGTLNLIKITMVAKIATLLPIVLIIFFSLFIILHLHKSK